MAKQCVLEIGCRRMISELNIDSAKVKVSQAPRVFKNIVFLFSRYKSNDTTLRPQKGLLQISRGLAMKQKGNVRRFLVPWIPLCVGVVVEYLSKLHRWKE